MTSSLLPLVSRLDAWLERRLTHFLLLLAFALAFHGHSLTFGLIYDDHVLVHANQWRWFYSPWEFVSYYRPLQALIFAPALVSSVPALLHLENVTAATLIVFLFGRVLLSLGFGCRLTALVEAVGIILPTSMPLFVWISQRTDWLTYGLGLTLVLLTIAPRPRGAAYLLVFLALSALALLSKESGIALIGLAPMLLATRRRWGLAIWTGVLGLALFLGYLALKSQFVPDPGPVVQAVLQSPGIFVGAMLAGLVQVLLYSWLPVSFTSNWLYLGLGVVYGGCAFMGLASMWNRQRPAAIVLAAEFLAFGLGTILRPEARNLALPGLVVGAFACYGLARLVESGRERGTGGIEVLLVATSLCSLATISVFSSYALQGWVEPINAHLEGRSFAPHPSSYHPIDIYTPILAAPARPWENDSTRDVAR